jgi:hypothetical protein
VAVTWPPVPVAPLAPVLEAPPVPAPLAAGLPLVALGEPPAFASEPLSPQAENANSASGANAKRNTAEKPVWKGRISAP